MGIKKRWVERIKKFSQWNGNKIKRASERERERVNDDNISLAKRNKESNNNNNHIKHININSNKGNYYNANFTLPLCFLHPIPIYRVHFRVSCLRPFLSLVNFSHLSTCHCHCMCVCVMHEMDSNTSTICCLCCKFWLNSRLWLHTSFKSKTKENTRQKKIAKNIHFC